MVINGKSLVELAPIKNMLTQKFREHGVSHGLAEVGYDLRLKQEVIFKKQHYASNGFPSLSNPKVMTVQVDGDLKEGKFTIASAVEEFDIPTTLMGIVHDKSTWARRGLSVFNTVLEPGWKGFLTLELVYHGEDELILPAGCGIAQVVFHEVKESAQYDGKYQNQADKPVEAHMEFVTM